MKRPVRPVALVILTACALYPGLDACCSRASIRSWPASTFTLVGQHGPWMDLAPKLGTAAGACRSLLKARHRPGVAGRRARACGPATGARIRWRCSAAVGSLLYPGGPTVMGVIALICLIVFRETEAVPACVPRPYAPIASRDHEPRPHRRPDPDPRRGARAVRAASSRRTPRAGTAEAIVPHDAVATLAEQGFLGMAIPEEWGGLGYDARTIAIVIEEIARVSAALAIMIAVHNSVGALPVLPLRHRRAAQALPAAAGVEGAGRVLAVRAGRRLRRRRARGDRRARRRSLRAQRQQELGDQRRSRPAST